MPMKEDSCPTEYYLNSRHDPRLYTGYAPHSQSLSFYDGSFMLAVVNDDGECTIDWEVVEYAANNPSSPYKTPSAMARILLYARDYGRNLDKENN